MIKKVLYVFYLVVALIVLLEVAYRLQVVEFYGQEFRALNEGIEIGSEEEFLNRVLIIGDSFSAQANNYVDHLRQEFPAWHIVNSAVPGTGIREQEIIAKKRLKDFSPDILIYQFYVGNDFTDIVHPINFRSNSLLRNLYWWLSDRILILSYVNRKLAGLRGKKANTVVGSYQNSEFSVSSYNARVKIYINAEPDYLQRTVGFDNSIHQVYNLWKSKTSNLFSSLPQHTQVYILVLPHCTQITEQKVRQYAELGASVSSGMLKTNYELLSQIEEDFQNVNIIDPQPHFQQVTKPDSLYYTNDPHLTSYGQAILAESIVKTYRNLPR